MVNSMLQGRNPDLRTNPYLPRSISVKNPFALSFFQNWNNEMVLQNMKSRLDSLQPLVARSNLSEN